MNHHRPSRNDPCPCGSGKKYKDCCRRKEVDAQSTRPSPKITDLGGKPKKHPKYPIGTVALYGPNDKITTKIAASAIKSPNAEPILERWVATDVITSPKVQRETKKFFERHGVRSIAMREGNMGCPHEEGEDFPDGEDCPFCPFWAGKQGSNQRF
jgi:hypothetical protein